MRLREVAMSWVRANCPPGDVHRDIADRLGAAMQQNVTCSFIFGRELIKSGQPYLVCCFNGEFFAFQLTPRQLAGLGLRDDQLRCVKGIRQGLYPPLVNPDVSITGVSVDHAASLDRHQPTTGTLRFQTKRPIPGPFAVVVEYEPPGRGSIRQIHYLVNLFSLEGSASFSFTPMGDLADQHGQRFSGVLPLFFQIWTAPEYEPKSAPSSLSFDFQPSGIAARPAVIPAQIQPVSPAGPLYPPVYDPGPQPPARRPEPRPVSDIRAVLVEIA